MAQMDVGTKKTGDSISDKLTRRLEEFGSKDVQQRVEDIRYKLIIETRADLMSKAIDVIDKMEADLRKLERTPDAVTKNLKGEVVSEAFSDKKFEEIKKLREKVEKAHKAFDKALNAKEQKDFDDVKQLVTNQPKQESGKPEGKGGDKDSGES